MIKTVQAWVSEHFLWTLVAVALGGFVVRALYIAVVGPHIAIGLDATWYYVEGKALTKGHSYVDPRWWLLTGGFKPTANFPPLWPVLLSLVDRFGLRSDDANRLFGAVLGSLSVVVTGLIARRVAGPTAGSSSAGAMTSSFWARRPSAR